MSASRRRRRHGAEEHGGMDERWLLTYSDMITLLLALFIVLFAISTVNMKKFQALALGLNHSYTPQPNVLPNGSGLLSKPDLHVIGGVRAGAQSAVSTTAAAAAVPQSAASTLALQQLEQQIQAALDARHLQGDVHQQLQRRGLIIQVLADKVFFASDSARVGPVGDAVIDTVSTVLRTKVNAVDVEGYTDNQPITGGIYTSNEELSAMRAVNVVLRMRTDGIAPGRLAATGYGSSHPDAPNTSPANMALNRRIDIVVLAGADPQP